MMQTFRELLPDFYRFLVKQGTCTPSSITNYISWLKFLDESYNLTIDLTVNEIETILNNEVLLQNTRNKYTKPRDISNFRSSLRKFYEFAHSETMDLLKIVWKEDRKKEIEIEKSDVLTTTEKETLIRARVGQGLFRNQLISYWGCCAVTGWKRTDLLVASHIKPWRDSDNSERIDLFNGLLLNPILDKLFDQGYVTFDSKGKIIISKYITTDELELLNLNKRMCLFKFENKHDQYLQYHRDNIYIV